MYKTFKIAKTSDKFCDDFTFGLYDENIPEQIRDKINTGITEFGMPWTECIPQCIGSFHVFSDFETLQYFITNICKLTEVEISELKRCGYSLYKFNTDLISKGLSHSRATIFKDEVENITELDIEDLFNPDSICKCKEKSSSKDITFCKNRYYKVNK
jgi:hypothetical protein